MDHLKTCPKPIGEKETQNVFNSMGHETSFLPPGHKPGDPAREAAVPDQLSFRRFLPLDPLTQPVPDETTVPHGRHGLEAHALAGAIFARVRDLCQARPALLAAA